jgi:hypothetical protein
MEMTQNFSFDKLPFDLSFLDIEKETNSEESFNPNNINVDNISIGKAIENIFNKNPFKEKDTHAHKKFELKYISKKRGRKSKNKNAQCNKKKKKEHTADDWDNNLRKIQVHFLNFIISILNDVIFSYLAKKKSFFLKFGHSGKKKVSYEYVEKLKKYNIKELIERLEVSKKYKIVQLKEGINVNNEILNHFSKYNWFNIFVNKSFFELFQIYYNNRKPLNNIFFEGKNITLKKDTKNFYYLLKENEEYEKKLIEAAEIVYLNNDI